MIRGRPRSLRTRFTFWYGGLLALCLVAYSLAASAFFGAHVRAELDRRVHEDIELAARALVHDAHGDLAWAGGFLGKQVDEEPGGGHWLEVWSDTGRRLLSSGTQPAVDLGPAPRPDEVDRRARTSHTPTGTLRVMTKRVLLGERAVLVRAAVSATGVRQQRRVFALGLGGVSLAVLALGGLGGWVLARRALGPLAEMAERARRITAEQLHERLPAGATSLELDHLRDAFNDTLSRLESSFEQLRRFTADASHELRTPLTALRSVGEVGLRGARSVEEYREVVGSMLEEVDRLSRLADELLTLARAESGQAELHREPVDLGALAREVADDLSVLAEERRQSLEVDAAAGVVVHADRLWLRQALRNLVDNAIKYTPEGGCIEVGLRVEGASISLAVHDNGPGIAPEHHERVFERFYRVDRGRSRALGGTGLGLALAKWAAEAHAGRIELHSEVGRGSVFRLVLPARRA